MTTATVSPRATALTEPRLLSGRTVAIRGADGQNYRLMSPSGMPQALPLDCFLKPQPKGDNEK